MLQKVIVLMGIAVSLLSPLIFAEEQQVLKLNDFDYGGDLSSAESEFRRFMLSADMIKGVRRNDLGDIRVFDGKNRLMPSLLKKKDSRIKSSQQNLSFHALTISDKDSGYLVDRTDRHEQSLEALELHWKSGAAPKILSVRVEHSKDKKDWKTLVNTEVLYNYKFKGRLLKQNTVKINDYTERYIRLTFLNKKRRPVMASVKAFTTNRKLAEKVWVSAGKLTADGTVPNAYHFSTGTGFRAELIKLGFIKINMMLAGSLYNLETIDGNLRHNLVSDDFAAYEISLNNRVVRADPIDVSKSQSTQWMVVADNSGELSAEDLPEVRAAYSQYEVIFAADGAEPYTVVWSNQSAGAPIKSDIVDRIKAKKLGWNDIAPVKPLFVLDKEQLTGLMESRESHFLLPMALFMFIASVVFGYRRYRSVHSR